MNKTEPCCYIAVISLSFFISPPAAFPKLGDEVHKSSNRIYSEQIIVKVLCE